MSQPIHRGTPDDPIIIRQSTTFQRPSRPKPGRVTLALIGISVVVTLASGWGKNPAVRYPLAISEYDHGLPEIWHGEIWRLFTPIFIHFTSTHIMFNMLGLYDLGNVIERRLGPATLLSMVAVIAVISNLAQYFVTGPGAGGMSGVLYGLFGYIWAKSRVDPGSGFRISQQTLVVGLGWLVLCFTGLLGDIANTAHVSGLVAGVLWGLGAPHIGGEPRDVSVA